MPASARVSPVDRAEPAAGEADASSGPAQVGQPPSGSTSISTMARPAPSSLATRASSSSFSRMAAASERRASSSASSRLWSRAEERTIVR